MGGDPRACRPRRGASQEGDGLGARGRAGGQRADLEAEPAVLAGGVSEVALAEFRRGSWGGRSDGRLGGFFGVSDGERLPEGLGRGSRVARWQVGRGCGLGIHHGGKHSRVEEWRQLSAIYLKSL